jgi:uncharacterized membrane protein
VLRRAVAAAGALALSLLAAPPALAAGPVESLQRAGSRIWDRVVDFIGTGVQTLVGIVVVLFLLQFITRFMMGGLFRRW